MIRYVIDTGVFYNPYALELLAATRPDLIVPVTVYTATEKDDVLWTTNPKDYLAVGLEADQVVGV